jgi:hypothetical protein
MPNQACNSAGRVYGKNIHGGCKNLITFNMINFNLEDPNFRIVEHPER